MSTPEMAAAPQRKTRRRSLPRRVAADPFLHFIVLAALIFAVNAWFGADVRNQRIDVSQDDLAHLRAQYRAMWQRDPDPVGMAELTRQFIREQVLAREAVANGMDRDDVIIRRRLVQQMDFLITKDVGEPDEAEITAYFQAHRSQYRRPATVNFSQRYINPDLHGNKTQADAAQALQQLAAGKAQAGDPLMLPAEVRGQSIDNVARDYGQDFASRLQALPLNTWSGPVRSSLGWHLVRVGARETARMEALSDVHERVHADLVNARLNAAREAGYQQLLRHYTVRVAGKAPQPELLDAAEQVAAQ